MCYMMSVGIRELRQNLSVYIRRVQRGEALQVTEHGRPVALLTPLPPRRDSLADMEAAGELIPARKPWADLPLPLPATPGAPTLSEILADMREEDER
jgi:prevent-host-death family protein